MPDAIDLNFQRAMGLMSSCSRVGEAVFTHDVVIVDSGAQNPAFNIGFPLRGTYKLDRSVARIETHFADRGRPFRVLMRRELETEVEPVLGERGYLRSGDRLPGMVLPDLAPTAAWNTHCEVAGLRVERVVGAATKADFADTAFDGFGLPVEAARVVLGPRLFEDPAVSAFVGYMADQPVCCSLLYATGAVGGIYWVAVRERQRGRGLGAAITARAATEARARGCALASLQASAMGKPVYARMGFSLDREYTDFRKPT